MVKGDISIYRDMGGVEHVAVVTETHDDGEVALCVLKTSLHKVKRSANPGPGEFLDPSFVEPVAEATVENPAHGDPAEVALPGMTASDEQSAAAEEPYKRSHHKKVEDQQSE